MDVPADDDGDESTQPEATQASAAPPPEQASFPDATPPPPPPRVDLGGDAPAGKKGAKEKDGGSSSPPMPDGRAEFLGFAADQWCGILKALTDEMQLAGVAPLIDPMQLRPAMVATLDQVVPKHVKLTPPMIAAGGSTAIVIQYWAKKKTIEEARRIRKAKDANTRAPDPGAKVEEMRRADEEEKKRKREADEKKAAAIDATIGTPPSSPPGWTDKRDINVPSSPPSSPPEPTAPALALVRADATSRSAVAAEVERISRDPNSVF